MIGGQELETSIVNNKKPVSRIRHLFQKPIHPLDKENIPELAGKSIVK